MNKIYMSQDGKILKRVSKNSTGEIVVPEGTEVINKRAFAGCDDITAIKLPSSLKELGEEAFDGCYCLTRIVIPKGIEFIPKRAFADCENLEYVKLPSKLKGIGKEAFYYTGINRITIPNKVAVIDKRAFASCDVKVALLPTSLKELGEEAFAWCSNLTHIAIPEGVENIPRRAFANCDNLIDIKFPSSLQKVGKEAFENCSGLTTIDLPDSVETIEEGAFNHCSINTVSLPTSLKELGEEAFARCSNLTRIEIPDSVRTIPNDCFANCTNLTEILLHDGLRSIGNGAFRNCNVSSIEICSTVEVIGEEAFHKNGSQSLYIGASTHSIGRNAFFMTNPLSIIVDEKNTKYTDAGCNIIMEKETGKVIRGTFTSSIPNTAKCIAFGTFDINVPKVLVIPSSVKEIETAAFFNIPEGSIIVLQEGVTTINWWAFQQMNKKRITVYVPSTVSKIEGQHSSVDFRLDAANQYYRYDTEGQNIISKDGFLIWGRLLNGIPEEGVSRVDAMTDFDGTKELRIPDSVSMVSGNTLAYSAGIDRIIIKKGTKISASDSKLFRCDIQYIVYSEKSDAGISKNTEYIIPKGSAKDDIIKFLGEEDQLFWDWWEDRPI